MQAVCLGIVVAMLSAVWAECTDSMALMFAREISLCDVGNVSVSDSFNDAAAKYVEAAFKPNDVVAESFALSPGVAIVARHWFVGAQDKVLNSFRELNAVFDGWSKAPVAALVSSLNQLSFTDLGRQPSVVSFNDNCSYGGESIGIGSPDFGFDNLSFLFTMQANPSNGLIQRLCQILSMHDCSLITLDSSQVIDGLYVAQVTITSSNRNLLLIKIMNHVQYVSTLFLDRILLVRVAGIQVYLRKKLPPLTYKGNTSECLSHYWYLIFFLLFLPLALIVGHRLKTCGAESGKKSVRAMEWDIRSGVRFKGQFEKNLAGRGQMSPPMISRMFPSGIQHGARNREYVVWQNAPGVKPVPHQGQNMYYDPNSAWQHGEGQESQQFYPITSRV
ncbi:hypothetical protein MOQ_006550 [Trypanosoma cruzi marinkellei]|uniref:Uncharacterized protein n=1 Tax=Trypanosoma cruzi marinkellei TaxID=85056 RepID=K2M3V2_TRYCR|nr:hypothetical protein MOQ_006550 [Trypanosoma cruzi marinkellei]